MTTEQEDRIIHTAEAMQEAAGKDHGFMMMDTTCTTWDLTNVSPRIRKHLQAAADLADLNVDIYKIGDTARVRFI